VSGYGCISGKYNELKNVEIMRDVFYIVVKNRALHNRLYAYAKLDSFNTTVYVSQTVAYMYSHKNENTERVENKKSIFDEEYLVLEYTSGTLVRETCV
jgi:hypothetical protein